MLALKRLIGLPSRQGDVPRSVRQAIAFCQSLVSERGEVSAGRLASDALMAYQSIEKPDLGAFFDLLIENFSPDPEEVMRWSDAYRKDSSPANLARLQRAVRPPRHELFQRLNTAPGGTRILVEMRGQLLSENGRNPQWAPIEADLGHLFTSWFNRGFLVLQRIDWRTPAIILEKLIEYEAVHEIQGWRDLRRRLEADRRCYAFFHPALPDEPIIFIEVALTRGMSAKVQPLLDPDSSIFDPSGADCAMFYSFTNCQEGLRGVPFGSFLLSKVAEDLGREFPRLRTFATLSPIPGFRDWLTAALRPREDNAGYAMLSGLLARLEGPQWFADKELSAAALRELGPACAYYLLSAKQAKEPFDSVARFHLRNGARLERIDWLGDTSAMGMQRSYGLMVNYVYRLNEVAQNHESYTREHQITASRQIELAAKQSVFARRDLPVKTSRVH